MSDLAPIDRQSSLDALLDAAIAIEAETARASGSIQFIARVFVQVTLPHSKPASNEVERSNGSVRVSLMAPARIGLPYGSIPRMVFVWMCSEVVRKKSRELCLGDSLSDFMKKTGLLDSGRCVTGGRNGSLRRVKEQCRRLFATTVTMMSDTAERACDRRLVLSDESDIWWEPIRPDQRTLFRSTLRLSEAFYQEVIRAPVPVDVRALRALRRSPLALDVYVWLTYRAFRLTGKVSIPWPSLQRQFGAGYPETPRGRADFRQRFRRAMRKVELVYGAIVGKVSMNEKHLTLMPMPPHVPRVPRVPRALEQRCG